MIRTVRIRGFKRFGELEFRLPGHVVLAGPNNTGKTTVLQAIASWALALQRWREIDDLNPRRGYARAPIARQAFVSVPLRSYDLLWKDRRYRGHMEIELRHDANWSIAMEFIAHPEIRETEITGTGLQRLRWRRYEIESYLVHPAALARFVESLVAEGVATTHVQKMLAYIRREFPPGVVDDPLGDHEFLNVTKARTRLLRPLLAAAGIHDLPYTYYHQIAEMMEPTEIHPEVLEKLDAICRAFGVEP